MQLGRSKVSLGLIIRCPDLKVVHVAEDRPTVSLERRRQVERASLLLIALPVLRLGVASEACRYEVVVARSEAPLRGWRELTQAA
jgi:hypothetical protein